MPTKAGKACQLVPGKKEQETRMVKGTGLGASELRLKSQIWHVPAV